MDAILAEIEETMQLCFYVAGAFMAGVGLVNFSEGHGGNDSAATLKGGRLVGAAVVVFVIGKNLVPLIFDMFK